MFRKMGQLSGAVSLATVMVAGSAGAQTVSNEQLERLQAQIKSLQLIFHSIGPANSPEIARKDRNSLFSSIKAGRSERGLALAQCSPDPLRARANRE